MSFSDAWSWTHKNPYSISQTHMNERRVESHELQQKGNLSKEIIPIALICPVKIGTDLTIRPHPWIPPHKPISKSVLPQVAQSQTLRIYRPLGDTHVPPKHRSTTNPSASVKSNAVHQLYREQRPRILQHHPHEVCSVVCPASLSQQCNLRTIFCN